MSRSILQRTLVQDSCVRRPVPAIDVEEDEGVAGFGAARTPVMCASATIRHGSSLRGTSPSAAVSGDTGYSPNNVGPTSILVEVELEPAIQRGPVRCGLRLRVPKSATMRGVRAAVARRLATDTAMVQIISGSRAASGSAERFIAFEDAEPLGDRRHLRVLGVDLPPATSTSPTELGRDAHLNAAAGACSTGKVSPCIVSAPLAAATGLEDRHATATAATSVLRRFQRSLSPPMPGMTLPQSSSPPVPVLRAPIAAATPTQIVGPVEVTVSESGGLGMSTTLKVPAGCTVFEVRKELSKVVGNPEILEHGRLLRRCEGSHLTAWLDTDVISSLRASDQVLLMGAHLVERSRAVAANDFERRHFRSSTAPGLSSARGRSSHDVPVRSSEDNSAKEFIPIMLPLSPRRVRSVCVAAEPPPQVDRCLSSPMRRSTPAPAVPVLRRSSTLPDQDNSGVCLPGDAAATSNSPFGISGAQPSFGQRSMVIGYVCPDCGAEGLPDLATASSHCISSGPLSKTVPLSTEPVRRLSQSRRVTSSSEGVSPVQMDSVQQPVTSRQESDLGKEQTQCLKATSKPPCMPPCMPSDSRATSSTRSSSKGAFSGAGSTVTSGCLEHQAPQETPNVQPQAFRPSATPEISTGPLFRVDISSSAPAQQERPVQLPPLRFASSTMGGSPSGTSSSFSFGCAGVQDAEPDSFVPTHHPRRHSVVVTNARNPSSGPVEPGQVRLDATSVSPVGVVGAAATHRADWHGAISARLDAMECEQRQPKVQEQLPQQVNVSPLSHGTATAETAQAQRPVVAGSGTAKMSVATADGQSEYTQPKPAKTTQTPCAATVARARSEWQGGNVHPLPTKTAPAEGCEAPAQPSDVHVPNPCSIDPTSELPPLKGEAIAYGEGGVPTIVRQLDEVGQARTIVLTEQGVHKVFGVNTVTSLANSTDEDARDWLSALSDRELHGLVHELGKRLVNRSQEYSKHRGSMQSIAEQKHFAYFGLQKGASEKELQAAYRKMAMRMHPDKNGGTDEAKKKFQDMKEMYENLKETYRSNKSQQPEAKKDDAEESTDDPETETPRDREDGAESRRKEAYDSDEDASPRRKGAGDNKEASRISYDPSNRGSMDKTVWRMLRQFRTIEQTMQNIEAELKRKR